MYNKENNDDRMEYNEKEMIINHWMEYFDFHLSNTDIKELINTHKVIQMLFGKRVSTFDDFAKLAVEHLMYEDKYPNLQLATVVHSKVKMN